VYLKPLTAMASLYAGLWVNPDTATIAHAMASNPYWVGGHGRIDSELMALAQGQWVVKVGADGVLCASRQACTQHPAQGVALKVECGDEIARNRIFVALLQHLGWLLPTAASNPTLAPWTNTSISNTLGAMVGQYHYYF
jgi:L-asparaginase II